MPDLIIKPTATSGNKLILQDQAGGAVLTTADSGATYANATLTTPTIANMANCTFPAGMVIQNKIIATHTGSSNIASNSGNYDTVISGTCTPKLASTGSYLKFTFFSNQIHLQSGVTGVVTMTLRKSSASNTYASGDDMHNTPAQPRVHLESNVGSWRFATYSFFSGTDSDSTAHVSNISSWSAGETLYWNLFQYRAGGSDNIMLHLANGRLQIQLEEITI